MQITSRIYAGWRYGGISINEGYFPNLVVRLRGGGLFYSALSRHWKFIWTPIEWRIGPWGGKRA